MYVTNNSSNIRVGMLGFRVFSSDTFTYVVNIWSIMKVSNTRELSVTILLEPQDRNNLNNIHHIVKFWKMNIYCNITKKRAYFTHWKGDRLG